MACGVPYSVMALVQHTSNAPAGEAGIHFKSEVLLSEAIDHALDPTIVDRLPLRRWRNQSATPRSEQSIMGIFATRAPVACDEYVSPSAPARDTRVHLLMVDCDLLPPPDADNRNADVHALTPTAARAATCHYHGS
jgi:hypothetical protein